MEKKEKEYVTYKMDGDMVCCTGPNFINLVESPAGFGVTGKDALLDYCTNHSKTITTNPVIASNVSSIGYSADSSTLKMVHMNGFVVIVLLWLVQ